MRYHKHLFICINQRADGSRVCCGEDKGMLLVKAFKKQLKDRGLSSSIRAQRTGCLDACETGPSMVVYPDGIFYGRLTLDDVNEIVESHLVGGKPIERLVVNHVPVKKNE